MNVFAFIKDEKKQALFSVVVEITVIGLFGIFLLKISNDYVIKNPPNHIFRIIESVLSLLILSVFLIIKKPSLYDLGLSLRDVKPLIRNIYVTGILIVLLMVISSFFFMDNLSSAMNLRFGLASPIFEEVLFRGYVWYRLKNSRVGDISVIFITGILFGLFHLFGYYEYSYETGFTTETQFMLNVVMQKVLLNISFGLLLGYIRYKTKKLYPSLLIHSLNNIILGH